MRILFTLGAKMIPISPVSTNKSGWFKRSYASVFLNIGVEMKKKNVHINYGKWILLCKLAFKKNSGPPPLLYLTPCIVIFWLVIGSVFIDKGARD